MKKWYNVVKNNGVTGIYVYGEIIGGSDKWDESDVTFDDFRKALEEIKNNSTLELYINSPGGSVFTTEGIMSMINRCKERKNIKVIAYIDGLGASCASWLPMVADEIVVYSNSIMMLHKPWTVCMGNSNDILKEMQLLDKLEDDVMIPSYMSKAKNLTIEQLKDMLAKETWLNGKEIANLFNVTYIADEKMVAAKLDGESLKNYKNVPKDLKDKSLTNKPVMSEGTRDLLTEARYWTEQIYK